MATYDEEKFVELDDAYRRAADVVRVMSGARARGEGFNPDEYRDASYDRNEKLGVLAEFVAAHPEVND